jgi:hypothetical protein
MHQLPSEAEGGELAAAQRAASSSEQAACEAEMAALALAVLVRLTAHAGAFLAAHSDLPISGACQQPSGCSEEASQQHASTVTCFNSLRACGVVHLSGAERA